MAEVRTQRHPGGLQDLWPHDRDRRQVRRRRSRAQTPARGEMVARSDASITSRISGVDPASSRMSSSKCCEAASPVSRLVRLFGRTGIASGISASDAYRDLAPRAPSGDRAARSGARRRARALRRWRRGRAGSDCRSRSRRARRPAIPRPGRYRPPARAAGCPDRCARSSPASAAISPREATGTTPSVTSPCGAVAFARARRLPRPRRPRPARGRAAACVRRVRSAPRRARCGGTAGRRCRAPAPTSAGSAPTARCRAIAAVRA